MYKLYAACQQTDCRHTEDLQDSLPFTILFNMGRTDETNQHGYPAIVKIDSKVPRERNINSTVSWWKELPTVYET